MWAFFSGIDAVCFITQYREYGFNDKIPLTVNIAAINEYVYPQVGDAALGVIGNAPRNNPQSPEFIRFRDTVKTKGVGATFFAKSAYGGGLFIVKTLQAVNGKIKDKEGFLKEL